MDEINKINLSEQTKFRLDEISKIENYFIEEINQRKSCSQKVNRYITTFDYTDKILVVLSATRAPVRMASAIFTLIFSLTTGIVKKLLNITRKKKQKA